MMEKNISIIFKSHIAFFVMRLIVIVDIDTSNAKYQNYK